MGFREVLAPPLERKSQATPWTIIPEQAPVCKKCDKTNFQKYFWNIKKNPRNQIFFEKSKFLEHFF